MQKLTFLDKSANCCFEPFFVEAHPPSPWLPNTISYKREFLMVIITPEHVASSNNIKIFSSSSNDTSNVNSVIINIH